MHRCRGTSYTRSFPFCVSAFTGVGFLSDQRFCLPKLRPDMDHLPPELIELVIDNLLNEKEALKACSLTSRALLPRSQVHLLESIALSFENMKDIQARVSSDPCRTLFRTRILRIYDSESIQPHDLDEVLDAFMAFKNVRDLRLRLSATHFVGLDFTLTSPYSIHRFLPLP